MAPASFRAADAALERGDHAAADTAYRAILADEPGNLRARTRLGAVLIVMRRVGEAVAVLKAAGADAPEQPAVAFRLGVAYAHAGRTADAVAALERAGELGFRQRDELTADPAVAALIEGPGATAAERIRRNAAPRADDPRSRELDFWIGDWDVFLPDGSLAGRNRISSILDGAAILEQWAGSAGVTGTSLNWYDRSADEWRQTWVDSDGDALEYRRGARDGDRMVLEERVDATVRRLTLEDRGPDRVRQLFERSDDGGATWTVEYDLAYERRPD
jgi:tetratricopeptide (TPR) repeat protein